MIQQTLRPRANFTTQKGTVLPIRDLKGKEYLDVAYRIQWFREEHPDWSISTKCEVNLEKKTCLSFCEIRDDKGKLVSTAHKFEFSGSFAFFVEKAETGAIGRALALCGYGTQFTNEFDHEDPSDPNNSLADSPLEATKHNRPIQGEAKEEVHQKEHVLEPWTQGQKKEYCIRKWGISDGKALSPEQKGQLLSVCTSTSYDDAMANLQLQGAR